MPFEPRIREDMKTHVKKKKKNLNNDHQSKMYLCIKWKI